MYTVNLDGQLLYDPRVEELIIMSPELDLEAGKVGGFDFQILQSHPLYNSIQRLKSIVEVYQDRDLLYRGRVLNDTTDFYNTKAVVCEGELSYFNDSIVRPYEYAGSVKDYLQMLINQHNAQVEPDKAFILGQVTVTDPNDFIPRSDSTYPKTWNVINEKLVNRLGGYLLLRRERGANYVDYLADSPYTSNQVIRLTENLLDVEQLKRAEDIATAIIPLGAVNEGESGNEKKLTIESVNGGKDFLYNAEAVKKYGWIFKPVEFPDVYTPDILKRRGETELSNIILTDISIEVSAVDLSLVDLSVDNFKLFEYVTVDSVPHGLNAKMLITKMKINLVDPSKTILSIGSHIRTFTEKQLRAATAISQITNEVVSIEPQIHAMQRDVYSVLKDVNAVQKNVGTVQNSVDLVREELSTIYTAFSFHNGGAGVAIGKTATKKGLEIDMDTEINKRLRLKKGIENELSKPVELLNGWSNYDLEKYAQAEFWKDSNGVVHLSGVITGGEAAPGTVLLSLPKSYRPEADEVLNAWSKTGAIRLDIKASGELIINSGDVDNTLVSLSGITFRAE